MEEHSATYSVKYNPQRGLYIIASSNGKVPPSLDGAWTDRLLAEKSMLNWVEIERAKIEKTKPTKQVRRRTNNGG